MRGGAAWRGTRRAARSAALALLAAGLWAGGCVHAEHARPAPGLAVHDFGTPSDRETYCAWYGDARGGVLYFGQAAFWSALREAGHPTADLAAPGPVRIGRFDARREQPLDPLEVGAPGDRSGVWDVLALPDGRVFFTTFFEAAGIADPATGGSRRLPRLGAGLNELAPGPDGTILASRYGGPEGGDGSVVLIGPDGELLAEHPIRPPPGYRSAPKTVAWDPVREEIWVTTDLLPRRERGPVRHDAYVLGADGDERLRIADREVQFVVFDGDGTGYRAERSGRRLFLRVTPPGAGARAGRRILLDPDFPTDLDFAQDVKLPATGGALVTRWSGAVHRVAPSDEVRTVRLPRRAGDGLYYTAVLHDGRICATYCRGVEVVCDDAAGPGGPG